MKCISLLKCDPHPTNLSGGSGFQLHEFLSGSLNRFGSTEQFYLCDYGGVIRVNKITSYMTQSNRKWFRVKQE